MLFPDSLIDEWVIALSLFIGSLVVIGRFLRATLRTVNRIEATLGVDEQGRTISDRLERVEHQLFPNGGGSLADKVSRIDVRQVETEAKVTVIEGLLSKFLERNKP